MKKVRRVNVTGPLSRIQDNIVEVLDVLTTSPLLDGVHIKDLSLNTGTINKISHKLGRIPLGWIVTRIHSDATIWDSQDTNGNRELTLNLNCSADVIIDIWVF